jgi:hypothetical protein
MKNFWITIICISSILEAKAATFLLHLYEGLGGDGVTITATLADSDNNGVDVILRNESTISSVVTSFAFEDTHSILMQPVTSLDWADANVNIPAASTIDFTIDFAFKALPPPTRNGINEGEELVINLMDANLNEIIYAFNSGTIRIATHVQSIGDDAISSSYVTRKITPEPSTPMLLSLAGACLILLRRKT